MKPKILLSLLFSFLGIQLAIAQITTNNGAIVQYADGSVFIGHIVAEDDMQLTLVVVTGDTLHLAQSFIKRIHKNSKEILIHNRGKFHYKSGVFVSTAMGWGLSENASFEWDVIVGKRLNKKISVGLGTAINLNSVWNFNGLWLDNHFSTIFAYGRYYLTHKRARIFASTKLGYGIPSNIVWAGGDYSGGVHFQPGFGVHFASRKRARFILTLSQMIQHTNGERLDFDFLSNPININYKYLYNRTMLKIGIEWK